MGIKRFPTTTANQLSVAIESVSAQAASALSDSMSAGNNAISALSQAISVLSTQLSLQVSALSQAVSALSQQNSVDHVSIRGLIGSDPRPRVLTTDVSISSGTIITISGLSVSVSAGAVYEFDMWLNIVRPNTSAPFKFGMNFPNVKHGQIAFRIPHNQMSTATLPIVSNLGYLFRLAMGTGSGSTIISIPVAGSALPMTTIWLKGEGGFMASAGGTMHPLFGTSATNVNNIKAGSWIKLKRIGP